jgi:large subunit ribosomal protein L10
LALSREKKEQLVQQYQQLAAESRGLIMTSYSGLTVRDAEELRAKIRQAGGEFHVVKNALLKLALEGADLPLPDGILEGTTAIGFADVDIPAVAKAISDLATESDVLQLKSGIVEGKVYGPDQIKKLANLPPLSTVQAQLLGLLQTPGGRIASVLASSVRQVVNVVKAYSDRDATTAAV